MYDLLIHKAAISVHYLIEKIKGIIFIDAAYPNACLTSWFDSVDQGALITKLRNHIAIVVFLVNIVAAHDVRMVGHLQSCLLVFQQVSCYLVCHFWHVDHLTSNKPLIFHISALVIWLTYPGRPAQWLPFQASCRTLFRSDRSLACLLQITSEI